MSCLSNRDRPLFHSPKDTLAMKNYYDCTFIINPGLDDAQIDNTIKQTEDTIAKNGGQVLTVDRLGRRRLSFPIQKKHNGFYVCIEFEGEGRIIEKVDRFLTLDENVMRFLTLKLDKREFEAKRNRTAQNLMMSSQPATEESIAAAAAAAAAVAAAAPKDDAAPAEKA
jgi:small subunit ribosomal protein S6